MLVSKSSMALDGPSAAAAAAAADEVVREDPTEALLSWLDLVRRCRGLPFSGQIEMIDYRAATISVGFCKLGW